MIIQIKYNIGDNIKYWRRYKDCIFEECGCCGGTGSIKGKDEKFYQCPNCKGSMKVCIGEEENKKEVTGTIASVHAVYHSDYKQPDIYYLTPHSYMHISQEDIIEKIFNEEEQLAYTD